MPLPHSSDESLHSLLDSLGSEPSSSATPAGPTLPDLIAAANVMLEPTRPDLLVPALADSSTAAAHASLSAALKAVTTLSKAWVAAKTLRSAAETTKTAADAARREVEARVAKVEAISAKKDSEIRRLRRDVEEERRRVEKERKRREREVEEVRTRLVAVQRREAALKLETRRRDSEYGKLQERVHSILGNRCAVSAPVVSVVSAYRGFAVAEGAMVWGQDSVGEGESETSPEDYPNVVENAYELRRAALQGENEEMRSLLRAVQVELDDLLGFEISAMQHEHTHGNDVSSEVSGEDTPSPPPKAPTPGQMELPFDMIREELEDSLQEKFALLRATLRATDAVQ